MQNTFKTQSIYRASADVADESTHDSNSEELLTVDEIASRLRVRPSWVYRHAADLGAIKLGKYLRFSWTRTLHHLNKNDAGQQ